MTRQVSEPQVTIEELRSDGAPGLGLELRAGAAGLGRNIAVPRIQKPGLALTGYREQLDEGRLLSLGGTEIEYLEQISADERRIAVATILAAAPACVVVTRGLEPPAELARACDESAVPLLVTSLDSGEFFARASRFLQERLAPATSVHGVLLDVLGVGVLLLGKSGVGKSEAALDLVFRGHRLVADDVVHIRRVARNLVHGSGAEVIRHHMEIRGLGIINIKDLFGIAAVREHKKVELVIELCEWEEGAQYDRLGLDEESYEIHGERLPMLRLPVRPGRNLATIIEVAARNQLLKRRGRHSGRELEAALERRRMADRRPLDQVE